MAWFDINDETRGNKRKLDFNPKVFLSNKIWKYFTFWSVNTFYLTCFCFTLHFWLSNDNNTFSITR